MKKFVTGIFTAAALLGASPLFGDEPSLFERLDKNKDGFLSGDEVGDEHKALFERMVRVADKDSDKKLSKDEFAAGQSQKEEKRPTFGGPGGGGPGRGPGMRPEEVFALFDKNKDGKLTPDEAPDRMKEHFSKIDQNADGFIDAKELELALGALRQMGASADPRFLDRMFSERDANKDGKLTASEVPEERREMFTRILKSTGKDPEAGITKEEMAKFIEKMSKGPRDQEEGEERAQQERRREERGPEGRGPRPDGAPREGRPEGERRPDADRRPDGDRPRDGERRPEGRPEGDRSPDRRPTADHRPNGPGPHGTGPGMHHHLPPVFGALDANHDGRITKEELETAGAHLRKLDRNDDGALTPDELFAPQHPGPHGPDGRGPGPNGPPRGDRRPEGDRPRDGERRPEGDRPRDGERRPEGRPEGDRPRDGRPEGDRPRDGERRPEGDRPRDGERRPEGRPEGDRPRDGRPEGDRPRDGQRRPEAGPNHEEFLRRMKEADKDGNGKLSREEAPERLKANFERIDKNGDGQIDEAELRGILEQAGGRGGEGRPDGNRGPRPERADKE